MCSAGDSWSYRQLEERADVIASALQRRGVSPGALVGVCAERKPATLAALLGVLKTGAAYVPLDPGFPIERLAYMVSDARAMLTLADREVSESLRARLAEAAPVVLLDDLATEPLTIAPMAPSASPESPQYTGNLHIRLHWSTERRDAAASRHREFPEQHEQRTGADRR